MRFMSRRIIISVFSVLKSYTRAHGILGFNTGKQFKDEKCFFVDRYLFETRLSMRYYTHLRISKTYKLYMPWINATALHPRQG